MHEQLPCGGDLVWVKHSISQRFINKSDCILIRRNGIRDAKTHLILRFPWNRGHPALSAYACATKQLGIRFHFKIFCGNRALGGEPERRGNRTFLLVLETVIVPVCHLKLHMTFSAVCPTRGPADICMYIARSWRRRPSSFPFPFSVKLAHPTALWCDGTASMFLTLWTSY